jgi:hypothetical protein
MFSYCIEPFDNFPAGHFASLHPPGGLALSSGMDRATSVELQPMFKRVFQIREIGRPAKFLHRLPITD